jgi:hypothetical protein
MRTWIFQGNPNYFDITGYLRARTEIIWEAKKKKASMELEDVVYMWRADAGKPGTGGVIARGTMTTLPEFRDDVDAREFYMDEFKTQADIKAWRVKIHIHSMHLIRPVLTRVQAANDSVLCNMLILKVSAGTNYQLELDEAKRLDEVYHEFEERE